MPVIDANYDDIYYSAYSKWKQEVEEIFSLLWGKADNINHNKTYVDLSEVEEKFINELEKRGIQEEFDYTNSNYYMKLEYYNNMFPDILPELKKKQLENVPESFIERECERFQSEAEDHGYRVRF